MKKLNKRAFFKANAKSLILASTLITFFSPLSGVSRELNQSSTQINENIENESNQSNDSYVANQPVPKALTESEELGEELFDYLKNKNWEKAWDTYTKLKSTLNQLNGNGDLLDSGIDQDEVNAALEDLGKLIKDKDANNALQEVNEITLFIGEMIETYNAMTPFEITELDYYGRELEIWLGNNDQKKTNTTIKDLRRTWNDVRPIVEEQGGEAQSKQFEKVLRQLEQAKTKDEYEKLTKDILEEVDNVEKVFSKLRG